MAAANWTDNDGTDSDGVNTAPPTDNDGTDSDGVDTGAAAGDSGGDSDSGGGDSG